MQKNEDRKIMATQKEYYINIRRSLFEHWIWDDKPFSRGAAWIDLIQQANTKYKKYPINGEIINLKRGEFITSVTKLAEKWGWTRNRVRRFLNLLECDTMVTRQSTNQFTHITLINYNDLNKVVKTGKIEKRTANGQQTDSKRTANGQQTDTINQSLINKEDKRSSSDNTLVLYKGEKVDDDWFFLEFKKITGHDVSKSEAELLTKVFKNSKENIEQAFINMRKYKGRSIKYLLKILESQKVIKPNLDKGETLYHYGCKDADKKLGYVYRVLKSKSYYCENCGLSWPDKKAWDIHKTDFFEKK